VNTPNYDAFRDAEDFTVDCVLNAYGPEQQLLGKLCSIATGWRYLVTDASCFSGRRSVLPGAVFPGRWRDETAVRWCAGTCS
jgi:hypothetical protein